MDTASSVNTPTRSLATIGVFLGAFGDYQDAIYNGISEVADERHVNLICFNGAALNDPQGFRKHWNTIYDLANSACVDGLIVLSAALQSYVSVAEFTRFCSSYAPLPIMSIGEELQGVPCITPDNTAGLRDLLTHLIEHHQYRRIAFIRGPEDHPHAEERYRTYRDCLAQHHLPFDPELVAIGDFRVNSGVEAVRLWLDQRHVRFDVIVASNDAMAFGAWEELNQRGIEVPTDVALVGFDDLPAASSFIIPLTTIHQSLIEQGRVAARMMIDCITHGTPPRSITVGTELVIRQSCGCLPQLIADLHVTAPAIAISTTENARAQHQEQVLRDIQAVIQPHFPDYSSQPLEQMVAAFFDIGRGQASSQFLSLFSHLFKTGLRDISYARHATGFMTPWQTVLAVLHAAGQPDAPVDTHHAVGEALHAAHRLITEGVEHIAANLRRMADEDARIQTEIVCDLNAASDIQQIVDILAENLPKLGIRTCALALYQGDGIPPPLSRLMMGYHHGQRFNVERAGRLFTSGELIPPDVLPRDQRPSLTLHPLAARDSHFGFILSEMTVGYRSLEITYVALCEQIGSAIHRTMLQEQIRLANEQLRQAHDDLERRVAERTAELRDSEERYRVLYHDNPTMLFTLDTSGQVISVNEFGATQLGYTIRELLGQSVLQVFIESDHMAVREQLQLCIQYPQTQYRWQLRKVRKDGSLLWVEEIARTVKGSDGSQQILIVCQDITERRQAEQNLLLTQFSIDHASIGILRAGPDARILDVNQQCCQYLGYSAQELSTLHLYDVDTNLTPAAWINQRNHLRDLGSDTVERVFQRKDGTTFPVEITSTYVSFQGSEFSVSFFHDISQTKRMLEALYLNSFAVERASDAVYWIESDAIITGVNEAACRMLGYSDEEFSGMSVGTIDALKTMDEIIAIWNTIKRDGTLTFESLHQTKTGYIFPVEIVASHISYEGKELGCAYVRDITQRKQAEASLQASEERLRLAVRAGSIGIFYHDQINESIYWSPEQYSIYGLEPHETITLDRFFQHVHPDDRKRVMQAVQHAHDPAGDGTFNIEHRIIDQNGALHWLNTRARTFFAGDGDARRPVRTTGAVMDITERRRQEEALRQSEERSLAFQEKLKALQEISFELAAIESVEYMCRRAIELGKSRLGYDRIGLLIYDNAERSQVSRFGIESTGELRVALGMSYSAEEIHYHNILMSNGPISVREDADLGDFEGVIPGGRGWNVVAMLEDADADIGWLAADNFFNRQPLIPYQVELLKLYGLTLGHLLTRKRVQAEIRALNEELEQRVIERTQELEEANTEIRQFAYIVSHDLRAPLVNLKGFSSELRSALQVVREGYADIAELVTPEQRTQMLQALQDDIPEALHFIESSVSNMDSFTKAILKLSRLGRLQLDLVMVDTQSVVAKTLESLSYQINQRSVKVSVGELPMVRADVISMEQIFGNILSNAVAYLASDRPGRIDIRAQRSDEEITFYVRDNGRGIVQDDMDKVFAPFRRAGVQDTPGEGMGLAYVQTLVRRHGGRIWCESEPGVETLFAFSIPANPTQDNVL